jgi:hypothetical protein
MPCRAEIIISCRAVDGYRLADKALDKKIRNFEQDRWRDMGVVMLTFEVHEGLDGALVVDRYVHYSQRLPVHGCRRPAPF